MTQILDEIERQRRLEMARSWDRAEAELAAEVSKTLETELSQPDKIPGAIVEVHAEPDHPIEEMAWQTFVDFCNIRGARRLPAKPSTVAAFLLYGGLTHERMLDALAIIGRMHDRHGLSNPTASAIVRRVLEMKLLDEPPPQSWSKSEREIWPTLRLEVRAVLRRIDLARRREINRCQDELRKLREQIKNAESKTKKPNGDAGVQDQGASVGM